MKKKLLLIILSLLMPSILLLKNASAVNGDFLAKSVEFGFFDGSTQTITSFPNMRATISSSLSTTNQGIRKIQITAPSTIINQKISPYQIVHVQFDATFEIGPNSIDNAPTIGCPKKTTGLGNFVFKSCDMALSSDYEGWNTSNNSVTANSRSYTASYDIELQYISENSTTITSDWAVNFYGPIFTYNSTTPTAYNIAISQPAIHFYEDLSQLENQKDAEDRKNISNQQQTNEDEAEDGKDEANTTGTTLMGAFSALITALGNVHSTNCKLPNMQVYTLQLSNMDLCSVNMPSGISALAGIAVSLLIVKLGISLVKRMLALYKEIIG